MLVCVRWHAAYPLSLRHVEEMMIERGVFVDLFTVAPGKWRLCKYWSRMEFLWLSMSIHRTNTITQ